MIPRTDWEVLVHDTIAELAAGTTTIGLYGAGHPRAAQALDRLEAQLRRLFADEPELAFVLLGEELFVQGRPFTRSSRQVPAVIRRMRRRDLEHVIFKQGVTREEVKAFIEELAATDETVVQSRPHIQVGRIELSERELGGPDKSEGGENRKKLPTIRDRVSLVHETFAAFARGGGLAVGDLETVVRAHLECLEENPDPLRLFAPWEGEERWPAVHAHNVCVLTVGMALLAGVRPVLAVDLGMGALVHDIGKLFLPPQVAARELELTGDDFEMILDHPRRSFEELLPIGQIAPLALIVAAEHHLNYNATGYPRLSRPRRPHPASRLVTVADAFDVLFTARGGRGMMTREATMAWLGDREGAVLDPGWTLALRQLLDRGQDGAHVQPASS
ncbi:MAG TPA: HD domain-containing phosphohydrolase [Thermoanaerobaculaceae bacterium]|nr:HD domain-containing phosphohydrolase [Thermoanaerobaculaceae bacterium]